ncbi:MAG: SUF system NifU family Fe-S cluster assembly protein [Acidobacteria bacterium]|nr:SUF system NifU family Fe-S cluster assembly protein [Acidobacteriota bacterium]
MLDQLYREVILDHHRHPRGRHHLERVDVEESGLNPSCGDEVTLQLELDGDIITDVAVIGRGCAVSTASGSMLAELVKGRSIDDARKIAEIFKRMMHGDDPPSEMDLGDLEALTGVRQFPVRVKCALLPWVTLLRAAVDAGEKHAAATAGEEEATDHGNG